MLSRRKNPQLITQAQDMGLDCESLEFFISEPMIVV